jgi:hypothetical protein
MSAIKELKFTAKINGDGEILFVVTKNDADNFQGLWAANDESHLREQLISTKCDPDDPEDLEYTREDIDCNYTLRIATEPRHFHLSKIIRTFIKIEILWRKYQLRTSLEPSWPT